MATHAYELNSPDASARAAFFSDIPNYVRQPPPVRPVFVCNACTVWPTTVYLVDKVPLFFHSSR